MPGGRPGRRRSRRWPGRARRLRYLLGGHRPDPGAADDVVAERLRAELGEHRGLLGGASLHADVLEHVAYLRGHVPTEEAARIAADVALATPGVRGVQSYLRVARGGPGPQPARPVEEPSAVLQRLLARARESGYRPPADAAAVHAVLGTLAGRMPVTGLLHLWSHLPADVCGLLAPPVAVGQLPRRLRREADLHAAVRAAGAAAEGGDVVRLVRAVLAELAAVVPEEAQDVASVLPAGLRAAWPAAARPRA